MAGIVLRVAIAVSLLVWGIPPGHGTEPETPPRLWLSPNVQALPAAPTTGTAAIRLGDLAYGRYFDRHGMPPPSEFLAPLTEPEAHRVRLERGRLRFAEGGFSVPLRRPVLPEGAAPMPPFVRTAPDARWILAVFPYYLPPAREIHHQVGVYTATGSFSGSLDTLPTHALRGAPDVLVAQDRIVLSTGYCEGLRWSFRVYDLPTMRVAEYGCPEGRCGDAIFRPVDGAGNVFLAVETVADAGEKGRLVQTGVHILDRRGALVANGTLASMLQEHGTHRGPDVGTCGLPEAVSARSLVAIRYLEEVAAVPRDASWRIRFRPPTGILEYLLSGRWEGGTASLVLQEAHEPKP